MKAEDPRRFTDHILGPLTLGDSLIFTDKDQAERLKSLDLVRNRMFRHMVEALWFLGYETIVVEVKDNGVNFSPKKTEYSMNMFEKDWKDLAMLFSKTFRIPSFKRHAVIIQSLITTQRSHVVIDFELPFKEEIEKSSSMLPQQGVPISRLEHIALQLKNETRESLGLHKD